jgi:hypothetical protein
MLQPRGLPPPGHRAREIFNPPPPTVPGNAFAEVRVQHGTLVWPDGADLCPSVLRYWCDLGRVCSQDELDAHFAGSVPLGSSVVAEPTAKYAARRERRKTRQR